MAEIEERDAAVFGLFNRTEWACLGWEEKAATVAHYRIHRLIELHQNDAVSKAIEQKTKQGQGAASRR